MALKAFQKKYLKSLSHDMKPSIMIGKNGLTPALILQVQKALEAHELIKVKILDSPDLVIKEVATQISSQCEAHVLKVIGSTFVLYKENLKKEKPYFKACGKFGLREKLYPEVKNLKK